SSSCLSSHSSSSSLHTLSLHDALPIYSLLLIVGHSVRALPAKYFMISACYDGNPTGFSMPVVHTSNYTLRAAQPDDIPQILQLMRDMAEFEQLLDQFHATEHSLQQNIFTSPAAVN